MYKRPADHLSSRHTDEPNAFLEWTRSLGIFRTTVGKLAKERVWVFYVFLLGYIGESGDLVDMEVNGREGDSSPKESAWVAPNCGNELDLAR